MKKIIYRFLVILWMVIIFWFSAQDAGESSQMSMGIGDAVGQVFMKGYEDWSLEQQMNFAYSIEYPIRKLAHTLEYSLLGFLLMGAMSERKCMASLVGILYAAGDEIHQLYVPGRYGSAADVLLDTCGGIFGMICCIFCEKMKNTIK